MSQSPKQNYRKYKDVALLYDRDIERSELIRVRIIIKDKTDILTPVTPLYEARFTDDNPFSVPARNFEPRRLSTCLVFQESEVTRTVYLPYRPTDSNLLAQIREVFPLINSAQYFGERSNQIEDIL